MYSGLKRVLPLLIVTLVVFMSSCTREYTCQCVSKFTGNQPNLPDTAVNEFLIKDTKKEATKQCEANSITVVNDNVTLTETCRLY